MTSLRVQPSDEWLMTLAARSLRTFHHYADGNPLRSLAKAAGIFLWYIEKANADWPFNVSRYEGLLVNAILQAVLLEGRDLNEAVRNVKRSKRY
jgi:hypothetical protein